MGFVWRGLQWLAKGAVFFTLFAFALNNQQDANVHFFFGLQWRLPLILALLVAFAAGLVVGVLGMLPYWWRRKKLLAADTLTHHSQLPAGRP